VAGNHFRLISSGAGQPCRSAFRPISRPTQPNHHRPLPLAFAHAAIGRAPPFHVPLTGRLCSSQRTIVSSSPLPLWTTGEPPLRFPSLNQHHVDSPPFLQCQKPMKLIPTAGCPPPTPPLISLDYKMALLPCHISPETQCLVQLHLSVLHVAAHQAPLRAATIYHRRPISDAPPAGKALVTTALSPSPFFNAPSEEPSPTVPARLCSGELRASCQVWSMVNRLGLWSMVHALGSQTFHSEK
jgi:hypothetical protein